MKQSVRNLAAFGSITEIMCSMYLTFFGPLLPAYVTFSAPIFINPLLICALAGLTSAGFGLAAGFTHPRKAATPRVFVFIAAVICIAVAAFIITAMGYFDLQMSAIVGIPALLLTVAAIFALVPEKKPEPHKEETK